MAAEVRARGGTEARDARIYLSSSTAYTFRQLCKLRKKNADEMLLLLVRSYVATTATDLEIVEGSKKKGK